jgi:hypothetical protein
MEHVIPQSMGGPRTRYNIVLSCHRCNIRKGHNLEKYLPIAIRHLIGVNESVEWIFTWVERVEILNQEEQDLDTINTQDGVLDEENSDELEEAQQELQRAQRALQRANQRVKRLSEILSKDAPNRPEDVAPERLDRGKGQETNLNSGIQGVRSDKV